MAAAHALHYQVGIPVRKVPLVLGLLTGMELTQGAITQDALRRGRGKVGQKYQELRAGVRNAPAGYTDDTGWKVGGENAHLMAFDTNQATVYQVRPRHRHQEAQEVGPQELPRGDGDRPGSQLRRQVLPLGEATKVSGPSAADAERGAGQEARARPGPGGTNPGTAAAGGGAVGGVPPG